MTLRAVWVSLWMIAALPLLGKDLGDAKWGCKLDVPDDWSIKPLSPLELETYTASARNTDQTEIVGLQVFPTKSPGPVTESTDYIKGVLQTGLFDFKDKRQEKIHGTDFYVIVASVTRGPTVIHTTFYFTIANNRLYQIALSSKHGEVASNKTLQSALASFALAP